jgi:hypothetical protein
LLTVIYIFDISILTEDVILQCRIVGIINEIPIVKFVKPKKLKWLGCGEWGGWENQKRSDHCGDKLKCYKGKMKVKVKLSMCMS